MILILHHYFALKSLCGVLAFPSSGIRIIWYGSLKAKSKIFLTAVRITVYRIEILSLASPTLFLLLLVGKKEKGRRRQTKKSSPLLESSSNSQEVFLKPMASQITKTTAPQTRSKVGLKLCT